MTGYHDWYVKKGKSPQQEAWYRYIYARRWTLFEELLRPSKGKPRLILDVGAGHGYLEKTGPAWARVVSIDREFGAESGERGRVGGDVARLPFRTSGVDGAHASHIIEHLDHPETLMRELSRVLRPGGALMVLTPDIERYGFKFFVDHTHRHPFTRDSLRGILTTHGFEIIRMEYGLFHDTRLEDLLRRLTRMPDSIRYRIKKRLGRRWAGELIALARKG